jgi:endonuclease YncB( thermonuclease family)
VVEVVDGDTIKVLLDQDGQSYTIRYIGMDTPENTSQVEYFAAEASAKNVQLIYGKNVTLIKEVSETDVYGRLLRHVLVDNVFVNYELVAQGYAKTVSYPPDIACIPTFQEAEQKARLSNLGLWNAPPTLAPLPTLAPSAGNAACNCSGPDLDCTANFSTHAEAQACYNYCVSQGFGDVFRLDGSDNDGLACETLP